MHKNEKGLTLVEVLAAISILSIIVVSFLSLFPQVGMMNQQNDVKTKGINVAKKILAQWTIDEKDEIAAFLQEPNAADAPYGYERYNQEDASYYFFEKEVEGFEVKVELAKNAKANELRQVSIKMRKSGKAITETYGYVTAEGAIE
ncbi:prepilin-type N-terminal cleavage/methylation domain-containing protein [Rossellomorea oryzaecorticis]|uniref:Prepilin-type N-terminal cleavage/methylation domain-containing protein n=1 Tax=Rossellomorea oryzaecorticis TaxID=1396505 RepID=A0ABU9K7F9_9BACI